MSKAQKKDVYNPIEQSRFIGYFGKPKRQRGRPKKRKRKRGRPNYLKTKRERNNEAQRVQNGKDKEKARLQSTFEGVIAQGRGRVKSRINWDTPGRIQLRERIADSWNNKDDMYRAGECFTKFCKRVGIDVNSLRRFLKIKDNYIPKKRGRKTLLPENVMRHICEGR